MPLLATPAVTPDDGFAPDLPSTVTLGDSGIVLNTVDASGVKWAWTNGSVLGNKPAPREEVGDNASRDGQWDATRFYGARSRELTGSVRIPATGTAADRHALMHATEQRLRDALSIGFIELVYSEPGFQGFCRARQQGEVLWTEITPSYAQFSVNVYSPDPWVYSTRERTFDVAFPSVSGGASWPMTWPATWSATVTSGRATLANPGRRAAGLLLHLTGPVTVATIANPDTGESLVLSRPDGQPLLGAGEYLDVDTERHTVTFMGTAGRRSWAAGDWLLVPPGVSQIAVNGIADPTARVSGSYRAARL